MIRFAMTLMAGGMLATAAMAGDITIDGDTTGGPTWNRTLAGDPPTGLSGIGTAVPYEVFEFTVTADGTYDFLSTATTVGYDNFLHLYEGAFDPTDQFNGVLIANDDFPSIGTSGFSFGLIAGTTYLTVNSGFNNGDFGTYTMRISGPGDIIPDGQGVVPEPATWAMMIAGFGLIGAAARRRRMASATA